VEGERAGDYVSRFLALTARPRPMSPRSRPPVSHALGNRTEAHSHLAHPRAPRPAATKDPWPAASQSVVLLVRRACRFSEERSPVTPRRPTRGNGDSRDDDTHDRIHHDRVDKAGSVTSVPGHV